MTREKGKSLPKRRVQCAICGYIGYVPRFYIWYNGTHGVAPDIYICDIHHNDRKPDRCIPESGKN